MVNACKQESQLSKNGAEPNIKWEIKRNNYILFNYANKSNLHHLIIFIRPLLSLLSFFFSMVSILNYFLVKKKESANYNGRKQRFPNFRSKWVPVSHLIIHLLENMKLISVLMHIQTQWFPLCAASNDKQISREDGTVHYAPLTQITQTLEDEQRIMDKAGRLSEPEIKKKLKQRHV